MSKRAADQPPPYEATYDSLTRQDSSGATLRSQLRCARTERINTTITKYILPVLRRRAAAGLNRTNIVLIPHNTPITIDTPGASITTPKPTENQSTDETTFDHAPKMVEIISSYRDIDDSDLQRIQLSEALGSVTFWAQRDVLFELRRVLEQSLAPNQGHRESEKASDEGLGRPTEQLEDTVQQTPAAKLKSRGLFARWKSPPPLSNEQKREVLRIGAATMGVRVYVELDEVCVRTQSAFGLYETLTQQVVIVRVSIPA